MRTHTLGVAAGLLIASSPVSAQDYARGQIVDDVRCRADSSQGYALYLPSTFGPDRRWPVIFLFDAGARGRRGVERYQAAAEQYGYIVAASNNSRNGPWDVALTAARAMTADVLERFPVDTGRIYTGGMSGGARVAMMVAMSPEGITGRFGPRVAGVLASSAGFPPEDVRESVPFAIFGTAGTDDFNYQEMRELDRSVTSPHRVEVFDGGHAWLPVELATEAVEWLEVQAMKAGSRSRDQKLIDDLFAKRMAQAERQTKSLEQMRDLQAIAADFEGLKDVARIKQRAEALAKGRDVQEALAAERAEEARERQLDADFGEFVRRLPVSGNIAPLRERVLKLLEQSQAPVDSSDRRVARRTLATLASGARSVDHPEFQELLAKIRSAALAGAAR
jgi:poly(3-hydroxybutyrate) depolymerase